MYILYFIILTFGTPSKGKTEDQPWPSGRKRFRLRKTIARPRLRAESSTTEEGSGTWEACGKTDAETGMI